MLADWIVDGYPSIDLPRRPTRAGPPRTEGVNRRFLEQRVHRERWDLAYEIPLAVPASAPAPAACAAARCTTGSPRPVRVVRRKLLGWERANWYAPPGVPRAYEYSFGRQNWFEHSSRRAPLRSAKTSRCSTLSSFGKLLVQGRDAESVLQRVCAGTTSRSSRAGSSTLQWLNDRGGYRGRRDRDPAGAGPIPGPVPAPVGRDLDWLQRSIRGTQRVRDGDRHRRVRWP